MPSALQAGRPVRRVVMSPLFRPTAPPTTLDQTPAASQPACRFAESQFRGGLHEIGRDVACALVRESALLDTRPITEVTTPPTSPEFSPNHPATDCCRNPEDGICRHQTAAPDKE